MYAASKKASSAPVALIPPSTRRETTSEPIGYARAATAATTAAFHRPTSSMANPAAPTSIGRMIAAVLVSPIAVIESATMSSRLRRDRLSNHSVR